MEVWIEIFLLLSSQSYLHHVTSYMEVWIEICHVNLLYGIIYSHLLYVGVD